MKKINYILPIFLISLTSCAKDATPKLDEVTLNYDNPIVIAQSEFKGKRIANATSGDMSDCKESAGLGITVESVLSKESYIFNKEGKPCTSAQYLFDGTLDLYSRAADPSVQIVFNDRHGKVSPESNTAKDSDRAILLTDADADYTINAELANKQYDQIGLLAQDYEKLEPAKTNNLQQNAFNKIIKQGLLEHKEKNLAEARELARSEIKDAKTSLSKQQKEISRQIQNVTLNKQAAITKLTKTTEALTNVEKELSAVKTSKNIQSREYEEKVALLEQRVEDFAQLALVLKRENERLAISTEVANNIVNKDLVKAEDSAEAARYVAMLKLAEDINVDEKLSQALKSSQEKATLRKAQRLQTQADALAYHASADKVFNKDLDQVYQDLQAGFEPAFKGKIARVMNVNINTDPKLSDVHLLLSEGDRTLRDLLNEILIDVQPVLGSWKIQWNLASHNQIIENETWNINAETSMPEFLDFIKQRVEEIHGVKLNIEQFDELRIINITDKF